jgi:Protein of unknown function (DUF3768)
MTTESARIRALNDTLRTTGQGGEIVITRGINALGAEVVTAILRGVQRFAAFEPANDPYGEHDFALLQVADQRVMFKIDYYNLTLSGHSSDAGDPTVTRRVLTVMLAEEY